MESVSLPLESGFNRETCFGQKTVANVVQMLGHWLLVLVALGNAVTTL